MRAGEGSGGSTHSEQNRLFAKPRRRSIVALNTTIDWNQDVTESFLDL